MPSTLIVFYSYTGNSRRLAQLLAAQQGWPVGEIIEVHPRSGNMMGNMRCALDSVLGRRPAVFYRGPELAGFETVVLVAPVWLQQLAGPMRSFVANESKHIGRAAVLLSMGAQGGANAIAEIASILGHDPLVSEVVTARQFEDGSCAQAVDAFGKAVSQARPGAPVRPAMLQGLSERRG
jgi:flavodoxin